MWGIGRQTEKSLNNIGIFTVGDLANTELIKLGKEIWHYGKPVLIHHAWGIDLSELGAPLIEGQAMSYGKGQTLYQGLCDT